MLSNPARDPSSMRSKLAIDEATAALRAGNPTDAELTLRKRIFQEPDDAAAITKLAEILLERGQIEEATVLLRRAASANPVPERRMALIRHLQAYVGAKSVLSEIESLPQPFRSSFEVLSIEAAMNGHLGNHDRQITIYEQLTKANPRNHLLLNSFGDALKTVGRTDEAVAAVRKSIDANPNYGEGWWTLANFKSYRFTDKDISMMQKALRAKLSDYDVLHFHFALGQAHEDRKEFAKSFRHYEAGNAIRRKGLTAAQMEATGRVNEAIAIYTPELFERHGAAGWPEAGPIFVVGLQRSGSTLIEQILGSHPLVESTTEIVVMPQLWGRIGRAAAKSGRSPFQEILRLDPAELAAIGEEYMDRTRAFRFTDKPYFVDKLPANWMNVGLIRLALPNAKIIDARRHPMACGFSNFKQNYGSGMNFAYSLESIGTFYCDYWRFMRHIDLVQPGIVHRVINERLIDDPEGEVRKLLEFIGVPFDAACLEFHKARRAIRTPSAEQVRRGISREGVDQWRNYEPWLGPLKQALGEALENWDLAQAPDPDQIRLARANDLRRQNQPKAALREIEGLGPTLRSSFAARATEAALLGEMGLHERELAVYEELVAAYPDRQSVWMDYGNALKTIGRTDEAIGALRRAIKARPTFGRAYWSLANLKTYRFDSREIAAMRQALQSELTEYDRLAFHFALGKALEDRGQTEESFKHYAAGNRIRASKATPAEMYRTPHVDSAIQTFTEELFEARAGAGCKEPGAIFVVGLQRSGSTLIEQILVSHPSIEDTSEQLVLDQLWLRLGMGTDPFEAVAKLSPETLRELGAEYLDRMREFRRADRPLFVNKQAGNWTNVGFIKLILPNAKIIDTRRHPMACGFSNFRQHYDLGALFAYSQESIGRFYSDYLRLMNHFDRVLPGAVHHVLNERLIEDPEGEVRRLLDYVGVPFDPACLDFYKAKRAVHSASSEQVRRPINRDGVDYWRRFEPWLGPLKESLGDALDSWDKLQA